MQDCDKGGVLKLWTDIETIVAVVCGSATGDRAINCLTFNCFLSCLRTRSGEAWVHEQPVPEIVRPRCSAIAGVP
jgi:hypothetical protein